MKRNAGNVGNGRGVSYSGECSQTFPGMSPNILGNVISHIPGNIAKHSWEMASNKF